MTNTKKFDAAESLLKLKKHLENGDPIVIFSALKSENLNDENTENVKNLIFKTKQLKYGFVKIRAHYEEQDENNITTTITENSLIIFADKDREKELFQFSISFARAYNQQLVLLVSSTKEAKWVLTNLPVTFKKNPRLYEKIALGQFNLDNLSHYFAKVDKKNYSFEIAANLVEQEKARDGLYPTERFLGDFIRKNILNSIKKNENVWDQYLHEINKEE